MVKVAAADVRYLDLERFSAPRTPALVTVKVAWVARLIATFIYILPHYEAL